MTLHWPLFIVSACAGWWYLGACHGIVWMGRYCMKPKPTRPPAWVRRVGSLCVAAFLAGCFAYAIGRI